MKLVQRGNKQLRVEDDRLEDMLRDGYIEVDDVTGRPVSSEPSIDSITRRSRRTKESE